MIEERLVCPHSVLVSAEFRQVVVDEVFQRGLGLGGGDGEIEVIERARMRGEGGVHQVDDFACDLVGWTMMRRLQVFGGAGFA